MKKELKIERLALKIEELKQKIDRQSKKIQLVNKRNSDLRKAIRGISALDDSKLSERAFYSHVIKLANAREYFGNIERQPIDDHTQMYNFFKDIRWNWNYEKYIKFVKDTAHIWRLPYYKAFTKMMYELMDDYIKVYEWAMLVPSNRVYVVDIEGNFVSIGKGYCWWQTLNEDNITKMAKYVTGKYIIPNPRVWEKVKEIMNKE